MSTDLPDQARSLRSSKSIALRRLMLTAPHIAPLADYVQRLRDAHPSWEFPDFDPLDGGVNAEILFLFEKPGPMTSAAGVGSGFISRDNDDPTALATFGFMKKADIPRKRTVLWNVVPGWNGTRKVTAAELKAGVVALRSLLPMLSRLQSIVLVGKKAQRASELVAPLGPRIFKSAHPSPLVFASQPNEWHEIPADWARAK